MSLGIDLLGGERKRCTFDCIYCQLGTGMGYAMERKVYVKTEEIIEGIKGLPEIEIDSITISGMGEPTLAKNLRDLIVGIKEIRREPVVVLTNSSLLHIEEVREGLGLADVVSLKLDVPSQRLLDVVNRPGDGIRFSHIIDGIMDFRGHYMGRLTIQIMFIKENMDEGEGLADLCWRIGADEVQINTPLRPCGVRPLSREELLEIKEYFKDLKTISVYEARWKEIEPLDIGETAKRRGATSQQPQRLP